MSEPDREPTESPTTSTEEAEAEGAWMARSWIGIAVVSILGLVLMMLAAMQVTGVINLLAPIAETQTQQWAVFFGLAVALIILAGWSWKAIASSDR